MITKEIWDLDNEYIITKKFIGNTVPPTNKYEWLNDAHTECKGKIIVNDISMLIQESDEYGNRSNKFQIVWLSKSDILKLAEKINESEIESIGLPDDELPF